MTRHARTRRERRWRLPVLPLVIALICLAGVSLLMYPTVASWWAQYNQTRVVENLAVAIKNLDPASRADELAKAHAYNDALRSGQAVVGANSRLPTSDAPADSAFDYAGLLAVDSSGLMARIKIPVIDVDLPIYHGTSDAILVEGIGHLEGTALPVGGTGTHAVLTGHRGLASATLFTHLDKVEVGDTFTIEVFGDVLEYRVFETQVVEPEDTATLLPQADRDLVTLVTCTPIGINSHRILVTGERVQPTPAAVIANAGKTPDVPRFPWWAVIIAGVLLSVGCYVWRSGRTSAPTRRRAKTGPKHTSEAISATRT